MTKPHHNNKEMPIFYACMYPILKEIAGKYGYALALHGSFVRDMDLIAIPWTEKARDRKKMIVEISKSLYKANKQSEVLKSACKKPHGRIAYTIITGGGGWVDISVMPRGR